MRKTIGIIINCDFTIILFFGVAIKYRVATKYPFLLHFIHLPNIFTFSKFCFSKISTTSTTIFYVLYKLHSRIVVVDK